MQSVSFVIHGFIYKIIIGPDFSIYFISENDFLTKFSFKILNIVCFLDKIPNGIASALSINVLHFLLFLYFLSKIIQVSATARISSRGFKK